VASRSAEIVRAGLESAGHYHWALVARLRAGGFEVVELNRAAVKEARSQHRLRRLKSDPRDVAAMAELMIRGGGAPAVSAWRRCARFSLSCSRVSLPSRDGGVHEFFEVRPS
jgi:transposase